MKKHLYLVSLLTTDPCTPSFFHSFAEKQIDWWHYVDGAYILVSKENIETMCANIRSALFGEGKFIIIKLRKDMEYSGWLPKQAWKWIKKNLK